jgi:hypothetical protein
MAYEYLFAQTLPAYAGHYRIKYLGLSFPASRFASCTHSLGCTCPSPPLCHYKRFYTQIWQFACRHSKIIPLNIVAQLCMLATHVPE